MLGKKFKKKNLNGGIDQVNIKGNPLNKLSYCQPINY